MGADQNVGSSNVVLNFKITDLSEIREIEKNIQIMNKLFKVIINNFILLREESDDG
jgi:hypothetical protein